MSSLLSTTLARPGVFLTLRTMFAPRIDNFDGDDYTYAGYLLRVLTRTLPNCILQLEDQVKRARRSSNAPPARVVLEFEDSTPTLRF